MVIRLAPTALVLTICSAMMVLPALAFVPANPAVAGYYGAMKAACSRGMASCSTSMSLGMPAHLAKKVSFLGSKIPLRPAIASRSATLISMSVNVKVQDLPNSQKKLEICVSADECQNAFQAVLTKLTKQANIPGFRKGKAPANMVLNHFGKKSVSAEACEEIIGSAVPQALQQNDIRAIGQAKMADENAIAKMLETFQPGQPVTFEVLVDVWPQPELKGIYTGLTVEAEEEAYEEDLVQNALQEMRKREAFSVMSGADTKATLHASKLDPNGNNKQEGAVAVVDLVGFRRNSDGSKGAPLPDLAIGENVEVVMEPGKFFEGFVESIAGMKAGDTKTVPVTFPDNHKVPELRGLQAMFDVTIKGLKDKVYPTLDDEFAQKVSDATTLTELKEKIRTGVSQEQLISTDKNVNKALEDKIVDLIEIDIPETLVDERTKSKFAQMMSDFKLRGMDDEAVKSMITKENFEKYKAKSRDSTVRALRVSFVIAEIAKKEGIKVDPAEIEAEMATLRQQYQGEEMDEEQARSRVEAELERQKVLAMLKQKNTIKLVPKKAVTPK